MTDSLLTRYRPETLEEVIGQPQAVKSLEAAIKNKRGRAFLFTGGPGTGKTTMARIAARMLGCPASELLEVDAATKTGIDDMRAVAESLMYRPLGEGAVKAVLVDECHALSKAAITALLKSIEEPPEWAYWFFCTTEPGRIPEAIVTRCLRYDLKPVSRADLRALLDYIVEQEKMEFDQKNAGSILDLCAQEARGSPRQALANLGTVAEATTRSEAAELLRTASKSEDAIALARLLAAGGRWSQVQEIIKAMGEIDPESVRHVVRAYFTKVALSASKEEQAGRALEVLDAFSTPFYRADGLSPLVLACGKVLLAS